MLCEISFKEVRRTEKEKNNKTLYSLFVYLSRGLFALKALRRCSIRLVNYVDFFKIFYCWVFVSVFPNKTTVEDRNTVTSVIFVYISNNWNNQKGVNRICIVSCLCRRVISYIWVYCRMFP